MGYDHAPFRPPARRALVKKTTKTGWCAHWVTIHVPFRPPARRALVKNNKNWLVCALGYDPCSVSSTSSATPRKIDKNESVCALGGRYKLRFDHQLGDPLEKFIKNGSVCALGCDPCSVSSTRLATPRLKNKKNGSVLALGCIPYSVLSTSSAISSKKFIKNGPVRGMDAIHAPFRSPVRRALVKNHQNIR